MLGHQAGGTGDRPRVGFTVTLEESIGYHRKHVIWRRCFDDANRPTKIVLRGSVESAQYASEIYRTLLAEHGLIGSMGRRGNPYDNAKAESFMKTLKQEEIYCNQYRDFEELSGHLEEFIGTYYNRQRLHSALGYRTPEEFERAGAGLETSPSAAATMEYFRPPHTPDGKLGSPGPLSGGSA